VAMSWANPAIAPAAARAWVETGPRASFTGAGPVYQIAAEKRGE